jgi:hypothetical protein
MWRMRDVKEEGNKRQTFGGWLEADEWQGKREVDFGRLAGSWTKGESEKQIQNVRWQVEGEWCPRRGGL